MTRCRPWLWSRLQAEWRVKVALSLLLTVAFCVPYFALQTFSLRPSITLPLSAIDRAVRFEPAWIWGYQSLYLLLPLFPWIATDRRQLQTYARGFLYLCGASFVCFALFPVDCPRPEIVPDTGMYALVVSYDGLRNAFPSLHVGLGVHAVLFGDIVLRGLASSRARRVVFGAGVAWVAVIGYSTIATKQHYFVDLPVGAVLAYLSHRLACRNPLPATFSNSIPIERSSR